MEFIKITPCDRDIILPFLLAKNTYFCEYSFGNLVLWGSKLNYEYAIIRDTLLIKCEIFGRIIFLEPCGDLKSGVEVILDYCKANGILPVFGGCGLAFCEFIAENYPFEFTSAQRRAGFDYIYTREALAALSGRRLHAKRNFINKYISLYGQPQWEYITESNLRQCVELYEGWLSRQSSPQEYEDEKTAIYNCFNNFSELKFTGILLTANGKAAAFTMGERLNGSTFVTHIEKASEEFTGAYAVINNTFAQLLDGYEYINREDDMGLPGLRRAKLSYNPAFMGEKYSIWKKN